MRELQLKQQDLGSTMVELDVNEMELVSGGVSSDTAYGASVGAAVGFLALGVGAAAMLTPVGIGLFVGASIVSSGVAIYTTLQS